MSTPSATEDRFSARSVAADRPLLIALGLLALALVGVVIASRISFPLFYGAAAAVLVVLGYLAFRMPGVMLIVVVFTPVVDRYVVSLLIPESLHGATNYLSEALLALVTVSVGLRGWRDGTIGEALRHPVVIFIAAFGGVGVLSALVNGVPPLIALAGIVFTIDAVALFVLPRVIRYDLGHAKAAFISFTVMATVAALLALGQVILHADFLGMESFAGRFNEGHRVAAFLVNPNMLGVILAMAIPLPLMATVRSPDRGRRIAYAAVTFVLTLALLYTFSRGAWLGLALSAVVIGLVLDRRAFATLLLFGAIAYASAVVLPRHILQPDPGDSRFDLGDATVGRLEGLGSGQDLRILFVRNAAPIIADHPVLGAGPGRYGGAVAWRFDSPLYDEYTDGSVPRNRTVDNFWLHLVTEFGVLGALLFGSAIAIALRRTFAAARRAEGWPRILIGSAAAMAIVVAVDSLTEMLLEGNTTSFAVWFFLGVASVLVARTSDRYVPEDRRERLG